ncbi:TnsA-like heteromeric transposase endonuclease subunit [Streptomyces sp. NPDC051940]|uniref:TnsA-like heteromeric transposase endonuclease subunit n=1 Tax=Streptomyces sp. NPDC051940 TaxID=3155675 RepID=UPI0034440826
MTCPVAHLRSAPTAGRQPMRGFTWRRDQRHRPGLEFLVRTGRLHAFESLEEDRLLLALDFCGDVVELLSQPLELKFRAGGQWRRHIPDFLVVTRGSTWLIDVRPARLIRPEDFEKFSASAVTAGSCGWGYEVVAGWKPHVATAIEAMAARRRTMADPLGTQATLLAASRRGLPFGELAVSCEYWPVARAHLLHLLWHRRLGVDLSQPLSDASPVVCSEEAS